MDYKQLPIYRHRAEIISAFEQNQVLIVESPTGSGKTTQLPLILHESGYTQRGIIGITQPRRLATLSVCDFISQQLEQPIGGFVGYKMRFEDVTGTETKIKVMTDGTLLQELKHDPLLLRYSALMVDEAHERSLTIDFILGLLKELLPKRPNFRLLVSSATIRTQVFSQYFQQAPIISIQAQSFPVQVIYYSPDNNKLNKNTNHKQKRKAGKNVSKIQNTKKVFSSAEELAEQICNLILQLDLPISPAKRQQKLPSKAIQELQAPDTGGDVLVFLPGEAHIKACLLALQPHTEPYSLSVLPLYARLGKEEQQRIFESTPYCSQLQRNRRKIILATNIAETSLTIEGVTVVIDTGLSKLSHFDSYSQHAELRESGISKASALQRKGRAGRVAAGRCYRLYSHTDYQAMQPYTQEEIQRTDLTEVILRMAELGIQGFESFDFLTKPELNDIRNAINSLVQLGALANRKLTEIGEQMCYFPLLPKHSRILIEAVRISPECIHPACVITAFLSTNSPFLFPHGQEREARKAQSHFMGKYGDFEFYLAVFHRYSTMQSLHEKQQFCEHYFLDQKAMHELQRITYQLKDIIRNAPPFKDIAIPEPSNGNCSPNYMQQYMQACLAGLQSSLCIQEQTNANSGGQRSKRRILYRSLTTNNIIIHPSSSLFCQTPKYLLAGEIIRTSQTYARAVSLLQPKWIDKFNPSLRKQLKRLVGSKNKKAE